MVVSGTPTAAAASISSASTQQRLISYCSLAGGQLSGRNGWSERTIHRATRRHLQQEKGFRSHTVPAKGALSWGARAGSCDTFKWIAAALFFFFACGARAACGGTKLCPFALQLPPAAAAHKTRNLCAAFCFPRHIHTLLRPSQQTRTALKI